MIPDLRQALLQACAALLVTAAGCVGDAPATLVPTAAAPQATPAPRAIELPADDGPHSAPLEWWYYNGSLEDEEGRDYGFHFVIFQTQEAPETQPPLTYLAQMGIADVGAASHIDGSTVSRLLVPPGDATGLDLSLRDFRLRISNGRHELEGGVDGAKIELTIESTRPPALHNGAGWLADEFGWTYYYSWTRMRAEGTLTLEGRTTPVAGEAWMDHQWGDFFVLGHPAGWQWFSLQLNDGADLMVIDSRDANGQARGAWATFLPPGGGQTDVGPAEGQVVIDILDEWRSPVTDAVYPARWRVRIPSLELDLEVIPLINDQEIVSTPTRSAIYWEGIVGVEGVIEGGPASGRGYVELTGYVVPEALPWR